MVETHLAEVRLARQVMSDPAAPQQARDDATGRYVRAADALIDDLEVLRTDGVLRAIADFLGGRA